jgi:hypothetical protein
VDHNGDVLYAKNGCLFRLPRPPGWIPRARIVSLTLYLS